MKRLISVALIAIIAAIALACGGGGNDHPPEQRTPTTDCQARPELCK